MSNKLKKMKKLLTIEDLVSFCQSNQLGSFSAKDTGYQLCVQVPAKFEEEETEDDTMLYCNVRIFHVGKNRNGSSVTMEAAKKSLSTIKYKPLLANFCEIDGVKDFTSHDMTINDEGNVEYIEHQIGCFTADEPYIKHDDEYDKDYVYGRVAIPRSYTDAADIIERKDGTKVSVELLINEMQFNASEKVLELTDIVVQGCTCLGKNPDTGEDVGEGMLGARADIESIEDFSQTNNSVFSKEETNAKLVETLEKLSNKLDTITASSNFNINEETQENDRKEEKFLEENKEEILENENVETEVEMAEENTEEKVETADETEVETNEVEESEDEESETPEVVENESEDSNEEVSEELDSEETQVTEEEACGGSGSNKKKKYTLNVGEKEFEFELSLDEKCYALNQLVNDTYSEADNCWYSVKVYEHYVVMVDYWNGTAYKQSYSVDGETFSLSGSRVEVYANYLTKEEEDSLKEMRSNYSVIETELNSYKEAELTAKKEEILSDEAYSQFSECEEFVTLKEHMAEYSVEELTEKADLAFAKCVKAKKNFSLETEEKVVPKKANKVGISFEVSDESNEPYGDYFKSLEV